MLEVAVVLLEGGFASTAIGPLEVFDSAGRFWNWLHGETERPRFRVRTASLDGASVRSLAGLRLAPELALHEVERADIVIVQSCGWEVLERLARDPRLCPWLRRWHARGAHVAGVCTGAAFLAEAGLLDGRRATTHWALAERLRERYPRVDWQPEEFVTEDGRVYCSGGIYASVDISLYLVEKFCGEEIAVQCARALLVGMPRRRQSAYSVPALSRPHADEQVRRAEECLQQGFRGEVSLEAVAARVGMSPRNFIRRFKAATGRLPGAYLQALRIAAARDLLERGGLPVQKVCASVGYADAASFRAAFKRHAGMTPAEYRARFARNREAGRLTPPAAPDAPGSPSIALLPSAA